MAKLLVLEDWFGYYLIDEFQDSFWLQKGRYFRLNIDKTDDKKKNTTSYTGGESSGLGVINPDVAGIMQKA